MLEHIRQRQEEIKKSISTSIGGNVLSVDQLEKAADDFFEKGGRGAAIGEIRTFGGREYIKTSAGWKFHGKGGGTKAQEHKENALKHHIDADNQRRAKEEENSQKKTELSEHAKKTPEAQLKKVVKEHHDEELRTAAQEELSRRKKEEAPQKEEKKISRKKEIAEAEKVLKNEWGEERFNVAKKESEKRIEPTSEDAYKRGKKEAMDEMGSDEFIANPKNYKPNTYYRVEGTGLDYTGAGKGMYVGRDRKALKAFYDIEGQGLKVREFKGEPKWLNLMDSSEYKKFEKEAIDKYGKSDKSSSEHMSKLAKEQGFDGIQYYDALATGEEFVLFDTSKLKEEKSK